MVGTNPALDKMLSDMVLTVVPGAIMTKGESASSLISMEAREPGTAEARGARRWKEGTPRISSSFEVMI